MKKTIIVVNVCKKDCKKKKKFVEYIIPEGEHYATDNKPARIETKEYKFKVFFDSSASYSLPDADQHDINKLTGFSDNRSVHQRFSARFGWRWSDDQLRLFAYVYNDGEWAEEEISIIEIAQVYTCKIIIKEDKYIFQIKELNVEVRMPRLATTSKAVGYRLYPYFGGNNPAPHEVRIWLKYL